MFRVSAPETIYYYCPRCGKIAQAPPNVRITCKTDRLMMKPITLSLTEIKKLAEKVSANLDIIPPLILLRKPVDTITTVPIVLLYPVTIRGVPTGIIYPSYWVTEVYKDEADKFKEFIAEKIGKKVEA